MQTVISEPTPIRPRPGIAGLADSGAYWIYKERKMPLPTIVDAYIHAAVKHAVIELMADGTVVATVPEAFGVVASGAVHRRH